MSTDIRLRVIHQAEVDSSVFEDVILDMRGEDSEEEIFRTELRNSLGRWLKQRCERVSAQPMIDFGWDADPSDGSEIVEAVAALIEYGNSASLSFYAYLERLPEGARVNLR